MSKELRAKHPMSNMQIIERFIDGVRYMKITPTSMFPLILENLKKMMADKPVKIETSESGWIKIIKTGKDEQMEKAVKKSGVKEDIDEDYILETEAKMLKSQGFEVKILEIQ